MTSIPTVGQKVRVAQLGDTRGMLIAQPYLEARQEGKTGTVSGYVPGHGGDVWWVRQDDGTVGAYCYTELEAL